MSKRTMFTTITPLPPGISRETVLNTLHTATEMIDLNPSHEERHMIKPPPEATPEEYHCQWYQITDKVSYLPAGMVTGKVHFKACFHNLSTGVQTHVYAPMGLDIKEKFTLGGNLPHEPTQPAEIGIGAPISGLYLREDVEMKCNFLLTRFVKKTLKDALATLVARLVVKNQLQEAVAQNRRLTYDPNTQSQWSAPLSPPLSPSPHFMTPPNSAPLNMGYRPEWAQGQQSPSLAPSQRQSLPPLPSYSPADYGKVREQQHLGPHPSEGLPIEMADTQKRWGPQQNGGVAELP